MSDHFSFGGQRCKVRCPKCRGQDFHMSEHWDGNSIEFTVSAGIMPGNADDHLAGSSVKVSATCRNPQCKHAWTVRGAISIYDVVADDATATQPKE